ncbi:MAG: sugar ABC transporter ATP-binding protein [Planctomycetaceae bacterium]|nr:sugar ABC transporter ATP-binding protein [Planctomycetaceae bacterium]
MRGIEKTFPGVKALAGVDLKVHGGEVLALLGENGAGKSTLMKVLGGAHQPNCGTISIDGVETSFPTPHASQKAGISIIYQEFNLIPAMTVRENLFLGRESTVGSFVRRRDESAQARALFERMGVDINPEALCRDLSVSQQQVVEIAKALSQEARILVLDEPSAALTNAEVERLFEIIRDLKNRGLGLIYISHRLEEVFEIADRVSVLRDGAHVGSANIDELNRDKLIAMMVGRELTEEFPPRDVERGEPLLEVEHLSRGDLVRNVSFTLHRGEILGLTGLMGAGRTETARLIFGADARDSGTIKLKGRELKIEHPRDAIAARIGLLTEDRKTQGLILKHSVRENFGLPNLDRYSSGGFVKRSEESAEFGLYVDRLRIKIPHSEQPAAHLSGGNQQKVVLAKWLARNCDVLIFDEPTRGIDVGAKHEIYQLMNELAAEGKGILMISSELPEVLGMSDRILVMHNGEIVGEIDDVPSASQEQILELAMGQTASV